ncbi:hypothetical protein ACS0TY_007723 [Phlomoides rotata]
MGEPISLLLPQNRASLPPLHLSVLLPPLSTASPDQAQASQARADGAAPCAQPVSTPPGRAPVPDRSSEPPPSPLRSSPAPQSAASSPLLQADGTQPSPGRSSPSATTAPPQPSSRRSPSPSPATPYSTPMPSKLCWEKCYGSGGSGRLNDSKLFQKNSFNSSLKLPSYIFRLQIEGQSCGRDDTEFYRFI